jgi:hypothetical protein
MRRPLKKYPLHYVVLAATFISILLGHLWFVIPGSMAGRPLVGPPNTNPIYSSGGFHCSGDGPYRIHYHTCAGEAVPLPNGTKPSDYPDY